MQVRYSELHLSVFANRAAEIHWKTPTFGDTKRFLQHLRLRKPLMRAGVRGGSDVCYRRETFAALRVWHSQTIRVVLRQTTRSYARLLEATPDYSRLHQTTREAGRRGWASATAVHRFIGARLLCSSVLPIIYCVRCWWYVTLLSSFAFLRWTFHLGRKITATSSEL